MHKSRRLWGIIFKLISSISVMICLLIFLLLLGGVIYKAKNVIWTEYIEIPKVELNLYENENNNKNENNTNNNQNNTKQLMLYKIRSHIKKFIESNKISPTIGHTNTNINTNTNTNINNNNKISTHHNERVYDILLLSYLKTINNKNHYQYNKKDNNNKSTTTIEIPLPKKLDKDSYLSLLASNKINKKLNLSFLYLSDSSYPSLAGVYSGIVGSIYLITIMLIIVFPLGIGAAIYLEEYAKKNILNSFLEVNINNLAAVPSIIYGLLGLMLFINFADFPRSSVLVGGMVLGLLCLPSMIIVSRQAIREIPYSIKQAAYGLGASKLQVIFDHIIPYAIPSIITGLILTIARAIGESAPLLIIGMAAFVYSPPTSIFDVSTALPMQIFSWSRSAQSEFVENASAGILILFMILLLFNLVASFIRDKFKVSY